MFVKLPIGNGKHISVQPMRVSVVAPYRDSISQCLVYILGVVNGDESGTDSSWIVELPQEDCERIVAEAAR